MSIEQIGNWNADVVDDENDCDVSSGDEVENSEVIAKEMFPYGEAIIAVIKRSENNAEYANKHIWNLIKLRTDIVKKHFTKTQKQAKLDDFFF